MTDDEEDGRAALQRKQAAGKTLSGLSTPTWPAAPYDTRTMPLPAEPTAYLRPLRSALQGVVGSAVFESRHTGIDKRLAHMRAWRVPALEGSELEIGSVSGIEAAVRALLATRLPGLDWWVPEHWEGPFEKYGILHNALPAPPDQETGQAMAIEIFGAARDVLLPGSPEWIDRRLARLEANSLDDEPMAVRLPCLVRIEVATYANVLYPGIGVPAYM